tara:strand:+ start:19676 stop:19966 length:291 start_codon:yes stop_codon:yes gene_type:complete
MAYILRADGETEEVDLPNGSASMEEIQEAVGGYFALIELKDNKWAYVNEEGQLYELPFNKSLSDMAHPIYFGQDFCGDALICETKKEAGFDEDNAD